MYIRPVDMIWHGGQMPNWLPYRYSFMLSFIIVALAAHCFEQLKAVRARTVGAITLSYIALVIYTEAQDTFITTLDSDGRCLLYTSLHKPYIHFLLTFHKRF